MRVVVLSACLLLGCDQRSPAPPPAPANSTGSNYAAADMPAAPKKRIGHREETPANPKLGELVSVREFHENGQLYTERTERVAGERERVRVGAMRAFWEDGKPRLEGGYDDQGRLSGHWLYYFENGVLEREGDYLEGKHTGDWVENWPNGKRRYEGFYHVGLREGLWRTWHENGARESEGEYRNNLREGAWKFWLPQGGEDRAQSGLYAGNVRIE